jgi:hypothetical protein
MNLIRLFLLVVLSVVLFFDCTTSVGGGGADIGNPLSGIVYNQADGNKKVANAMVILSKRGSDPGPTLTQEEPICSDEDDISVCVKKIFFDTTYTDNNGSFSFDTVYPANYTIVAIYNHLYAITYSEPFQEEVELYVDVPATIEIKTYTPLDTSEPYFNAVRVAGTGFINFIDDDGDLVLRDVPEGDVENDLDLILYRTDGERTTFLSLKTEAGCHAELYIDPATSGSNWTPHPCGFRDPLGKPYVLEYYLPQLMSDTTGYSIDGRRYDLRIIFSHGMDALSTVSAINCTSDDESTTIDSLWWEGGNTLYMSFCVADSLGNCSSDERRIKQDVAYTVTIDTTAKTDLGVHFAYEATIEFP